MPKHLFCIGLLLWFVPLELSSIVSGDFNTAAVLGFIVAGALLIVGEPAPDGPPGFWGILTALVCTLLLWSAGFGARSIAFAHPDLKLVQTMHLIASGAWVLFALFCVIALIAMIEERVNA